MTDDLDVTFDGGDISADDLNKSSGGGMVSKAGFYHVRVQDVTPYQEEGKLPNRRIDLHVLAGTEASEVGKIIFHRIYLMSWEKDANGKSTGKMIAPPKGMKMMAFRFFMGMGLVSREELGQKDLHMPFSKLQECQAIVKVVEEKDNRDSSKPPQYKVAETYQLDDPKVADVPKEGMYLEIWQAANSQRAAFIENAANSFGDI